MPQMNPLKLIRFKPLHLTQDEPNASEVSTTRRLGFPSFKKLKGGFLMLLGYALSPLCWWNDLVFNLPIAYGFGYLCSLVSPNFLIPGAIVGYWLSNIIGILLMQAGFLDVAQGQTGERNLKKELLTGFALSTLYTGAIVLLLHFNILQTPLLSFQP